MLSYPDREALSTIYTAMAQRTLAASKAASSVSPAALSKAMLEVYTAVRDKFTANDHPHYDFSPRELSDWINGVQRYSLEGGLSLVQSIAHEGMRVFRDRLVGDHQEQFTAMLNGTLGSLLGYKPEAPGLWYASTLGASAEERISGDLSKIRLQRWEADSFAELVAEKLKVRVCVGVWG